MEGGNEEEKLFIWSDFFQYRHNGDSFLFSLVKYNAALHKKEITNQPILQIHCHIKNINKKLSKNNYTEIQVVIVSKFSVIYHCNGKTEKFTVSK